MIGTVSGEARKKLLDSGILDYNKEMSGLAKGSDNIVKRYGVDVKRDDVETVVKKLTTGKDVHLVNYLNVNYSNYKL